MILLESGHRLVADTVRTVILPDADYKPMSFESRVCDFDNASFLIQVLEDNLDAIVVSLQLPCFPDIKNVGAMAALEAAFPNMILPEAESGYDISVRVTKQDWTNNEVATIDKLSKLKQIALGGIFDHYYSALYNNQISNLSNFQFNMRPDTVVYFLPDKDRVTTIFELSFMNNADTEIGKIFLNEFSDPGIRRKISRAPIVTFNENPPREMAAFNITTKPNNKQHLGYVSFVVMTEHCDNKIRPKVVETLQTFRNFVQYHLKCALAYFHSRMRLRVAELVKVLNRAKMDTIATGPKKITTSAGRVLIR